MKNSKPQLIHVTSYGKVWAIPADELKVGDVMICTGGETQRFTKLQPSKSGKTVNYEVECNNGKRYLGRTTSSRLIAIKRVNKSKRY
ncbi:MAG: hypothetical protein K2N23_06125 [Clostridia bacterium]|nr:hypothetical protein [Clostridia bacterium]